jgi:hypothetical protein
MVFLRVHVLDVVEEEIDVREDAFKVAPGNTTTGVDRRVETMLRGLVGAQKMVGELGLSKRLPSRKGKAPSRSTVINRVFADFLEDFVNRYTATRQHRRFAGASLGTLATNLATLRIHNPVVVLIESDRMMRTCFDTETAVETFFFIPDDLRRKSL